jgi:outer membrane protein assembly factor BamB
MTRRGGQVIGGATALLAAAVAGWLATGDDPAPRRTAAAAARPALAVAAKVEAADGLGAAASGFGAAWLDDRPGGRLVRLDLGRGDVTARVPVDGRLAISVGAGAVWALQSGGGYGIGLRGPLLRLDPRTNHVTARTPLRTPAGDAVLGFGVLADGDHVWVWGPNDILRIDARAGRVVQHIAVGYAHGEITGLVLHAGSLLLTTADGHLARIDARTGRRLATVALPLGSPAVRATAGSVAVVAARGALAGVDADTGRVVWQRPLGFRVGAVIHAGALLWVNSAAVTDPGDRLSAIDPATGRLVASALLPAFGTTGLIAAGRRLWIPAADGQVLVVRLSRALETATWGPARPPAVPVADAVLSA